jgi:Ca2+/Na+ antiporter
MHFVALPWKLLFAFIPPVAYGGGWVCFCVALIFIGCVTAVIGDLASLMGCCMGLPDAITAITIVALGTSLPDLFASKVSAVEDPAADNAIGNVTGSNAVNVFLGLGLPWMMAAFYWSGNANEEWKLKYPDSPHIYEAFPDGAFVVLAGDIVFSVIVFLICSMVALMTIRYRRKAHDAELGGPAGIKVNSAILFVMLWFVYVSCASWKTLAGDVGVDAMVLAVLCNVAGAGFLMVLIVGSVHVYEGYSKRSEERSQGAQASLLETVVKAVRDENAQGNKGRKTVVGRKTVMDMFRRAPDAAAGVAGGSLVDLAKNMDQHLKALSAICEELGRAAAAGGAYGGGGPTDEEEDAEEGNARLLRSGTGSTGVAAAAAEGRGKKKKNKVNIRRSVVTSDGAGNPKDMSQSVTMDINSRAAPTGSE